MRNSEHYSDPTAGRAINPKSVEKSQKVIAASKYERPAKKKKNVNKKKTTYYATPVYTAK